MEYLSNTGRERLGDALRESIDDDARLSIIASYFTVFAYGELKDELSKVDELCFIFDEPTFARQMESEKNPREFVVNRRSREKGVGGTGLELTLRNNLNQRALARKCAEWARERATFKSDKRRGMIATTGSYHVENAGSENHALMGSAANAFSLEGLDYERKPGVVTGVSHFQTSAEAMGLKAMFDGIWGNPELVEDVTAQVIDQVGTLYRENPPEFVYSLTLYHLFRDFMEDGENDPIRPGLKFEESVVWNKLYDFQRDAVVGAIRKLEKYKGCIIADSVGLGKTYEALAVIKYYEERNGRVLVLCPKRLRENWTLWTRTNDDRNPLADDRLSFNVLNHTDLSRYHGMSGDIDLEHLRWGNYDLVVIDESHNFRNKSTDAEKKDRYTRLIEDVIKAGVRTKVLMLSATPVNNKLLDLRNQIELITEGDDAYLAETDGIPSITQVTKTAQARFNEWSKLDDSERTTESFVNAVNADYFKLLDVLTIARSRKHITKYYGADSGTFPTRRAPLAFNAPIDAAGELPPIAEPNDMIAQLTFAQYQVLSYVRHDRRSKYEARYGDSWGKDFESQVHRTTAVANLMRVNVLKRMESSVNSFRITLQRILDGCLDLRGRLDNVGASVRYDARAELGDFDDDDDAEEFAAGGKVAVDLRDVDIPKIAGDLDFDITVLRRLLEYAAAVTPERDAKLIKLREFITEKALNPYNPGNRKVLVFSAFADTTDYLFNQLAKSLKDELGLECAEVNGGTNRTYSLKLRHASFENILAHFSPVSKELPDSEAVRGEIDVVFATDCISEGQNLQDCDCLVNYDIHWNPVRIIQRFGRIDRLGSRNSQIQLVNFWPDIALDEYIQLEGRVKGRMALMDGYARLVSEEDLNGAYVRLESTNAKNNSVKLTIDVRQKDGSQKRRAVTAKVGSSLYDLSNENSDYEAGWIVSNFSTAEGEEFVEFQNGEVLEIGAAVGDVADAEVKRAQIRHTIEDHFQRQFELYPRGIKVLSLFFIDQVERYRVYEPEEYGGLYAEMFEQEYADVLRSRAAFSARKACGLPPSASWQECFEHIGHKVEQEPSAVHDGYFSRDGKGRLKDTKGTTTADVSTYELIMRKKETLISFPAKGESDEENAGRRVSFIFSHSALKEGWDNPNVFQICTLVDTKDELTKRQKIGRGLRLCVDQSGERCHDPEVNVLTVIANESYEDFARGLQSELEADGARFGVLTPESFTRVVIEDESGNEEKLGYAKSKQIYDGFVESGLVDAKGKITQELKTAAENESVALPEELAPAKEQVQAIILHKAQKLQIRDKRKEVSVELQKDVTLSPAFQKLWEKIRQRTRFEVDVDSERIVAAAIKGIQQMPKVRAPQVTSSRADLNVAEAGVAAEGTGNSQVNVSERRIYDLPDPIAEIQDAVGLTRRTIKAILEGCGRYDEFAVNLAVFLAQVSAKIIKAKNDEVSRGIKYVKLPESEWYTMKDLELEDYTAYLDQNAWKPNHGDKSAYNYVVFDSAGVEQSYAKALDAQDEVLVYAKLPSKFKIDTPLGTYNPDWACVEEVNGERRVYFVTETKGEKNGEPALRDTERMKIECAQEYFATLELGDDFVYDVKTTYEVVSV